LLHAQYYRPPRFSVYYGLRTITLRHEKDSNLFTTRPVLLLRAY